MSQEKFYLPTTERTTEQEETEMYKMCILEAEIPHKAKKTGRDKLKEKLLKEDKVKDCERDNLTEQ